MVLIIRLFVSLDVTMFLDVLMKPHLLNYRTHSQQLSTKVTHYVHTCTYRQEQN